MFHLHIITIFPDAVNAYLAESIMGIAQEKKKIKVTVHNLRDYTDDRRRTVDDRPYGGGAGMLLKVEPLDRAIRAARRACRGKKIKVIMLDPAGTQFAQGLARRWSRLDGLVFVCGRYEGFDERVRRLVDARVSIGSYVLSGGELPALVIAESVTRLLPGVLGKAESLAEESFNTPGAKEYPHYTRPEVWVDASGKKLRVPKVLLSGDHAKISSWRKKHVKK